MATHNVSCPQNKVQKMRTVPRNNEMAQHLRVPQGQQPLGSSNPGTRQSEVRKGGRHASREEGFAWTCMQSVTLMSSMALRKTKARPPSGAASGSPGI